MWLADSTCMCDTLLLHDHDSWWGAQAGQCTATGGLLKQHPIGDHTPRNEGPERCAPLQTKRQTRASSFTEGSVLPQADSQPPSQPASSSVVIFRQWQVSVWR